MGEYINQKKLARAIRKVLSLNQELVESVLIEFQNQLIEHLASGHSIHLKRLGAFKTIKLKKTRKNNLKANGCIDVPEKTVVRFYPGGPLERIITNGEELELRESSEDLEGFREVSES